MRFSQDAQRLEIPEINEQLFKLFVLLHQKNAEMASRRSNYNKKQFPPKDQTISYNTIIKLLQEKFKDGPINVNIKLASI